MCRGGGDNLDRMHSRKAVPPSSVSRAGAPNENHHRQINRPAFTAEWPFIRANHNLPLSFVFDQSESPSFGDFWPTRVSLSRVFSANQSLPPLDVFRPINRIPLLRAFSPSIVSLS